METEDGQERENSQHLRGIGQDTRELKMYVGGALKEI